MKILILGGTGFLGPHIVDIARTHKHTLTLFNRGKTNPQLFPDIEKLHGDRTKDISALKDRKWDACIDTSAYFPREVTESATLLSKNGLQQYVFISTVSVYPEEAFRKIGVNEETPVGKIADEKIEKVTNESYGPLKALCELAAERAMPRHVTNIRPGLIVGPGDPSDRFTYWPARFDRGGEVLCPAPREAPIQYIDARDLAAFAIDCIEQGHAGVFNALGPNYELTMADLLHTCKGVAGKDAHLTWVDEKFLLDNQVGPWMELPIWVPQTDQPGFARTSNAKAISMGLTFRPPADTIRDTLTWSRHRPTTYKWRAGLAAEKEARVLKSWHEKEKPAASHQ